jgi:signal recognition particle GTPase
MGSLFQKAYTPFQEFFKAKKLKAIMVGLDCAGKTTMLYKMNISEMNNFLPIGFTVETA